MVGLGRVGGWVLFFVWFFVWILRGFCRILGFYGIVFESISLEVFRVFFGLEVLGI